MNEDYREIVEPEDEYTLYDYLGDHPIMLVGFGISAIVLGVCKLLDDKYNKGGQHE